MSDTETRGHGDTGTQGQPERETTADARRLLDAGAAATEAVRAADRAFDDAIQNWNSASLREWAKRLQSLTDAALYLASALERATE